MTDFDDVLKEIREAAEAGTLEYVCWLSFKQDNRHTYGAKGFKGGAEIIRDTLIANTAEHGRAN